MTACSSAATRPSGATTARAADEEATVRTLLKDILADGVRVGPDDAIDIGAVRDAHGHYRRATTTLREFVNLVLDELAARGVPIPPAPPKPSPEPAAEPDRRVVTPLVARVIERHRRVLPTEETIHEMWEAERPEAAEPEAPAR
jgi:hypothetical protein